APPSVDLYRPYGGSPGAKETVPPLVTDEIPRTPRVDPTYIVLPSTTIDEIERPLKAGPLYAGAVRMPPKPNTASQSTVSAGTLDRKSTRLNSSHLGSSYAVCCLKKKHNA